MVRGKEEGREGRMRGKEGREEGREEERRGRKRRREEGGGRGKPHQTVVKREDQMSWLSPWPS